MPLISADRVNELFRDCLYDERELDTFSGNGIEGGAVPADAVPSRGIMLNCMFNPLKIDLHREEITAMLMNLPANFLMSSGGGWSFLEACNDRAGEQWTGLHQTMDQLFILGQAVGKAKCLLPREMWGAMPGGMPYYAVLDA